MVAKQFTRAEIITEGALALSLPDNTARQKLRKINAISRLLNNMKKATKVNKVLGITGIIAAMVIIRLLPEAKILLIEALNLYQDKRDLSEIARGIVVDQKILANNIIKPALAKVGQRIDDVITDASQKTGLTRPLLGVIAPLKRDIRRKRKRAQVKVGEFDNFVKKLSKTCESCEKDLERSIKRSNIALVERAKAVGENLVDVISLKRKRQALSVLKIPRLI